MIRRGQRPRSNKSIKDTYEGNGIRIPSVLYQVKKGTASNAKTPPKNKYTVSPRNALGLSNLIAARCHGF
jgi:hypothetical protein